MTTDKFFDGLTGPLASLRSLLLSTPAIEELLHQLTVLAVNAVDAAFSCGISIRSNHSPYTVAASDERASLIDEEQYGAGVGPCLEALRTGHPVLVDDQSEDHRWPAYRVAAISRGVTSSLSLPLVVGDRTLGALNLYAYGGPRAFDEKQAALAEKFATEAATALALAIRQIEQEALAEQLEQAITSRSLIDQAIGILMGQQRCNAATAFDLLRRHSQHTNRRLRDVATDIIERYSGHSSVPPAPFEHGVSSSSDHLS